MNTQHRSALFLLFALGCGGADQADEGLQPEPDPNLPPPIEQEVDPEPTEETRGQQLTSPSSRTR